MPELPEVETIVRELRKKVAGKKLVGLQVFDKRIGRLSFNLPVKISAVDRHGKYIVFHMDGGKLMLHLRMSGRLIFCAGAVPEKPEKAERARFYFVNGEHSRTVGGEHSRTTGNIILRFFDPRRFGTLEWTKGKLPELGINPLEPEFSGESFKKAIFSHSRGVKNLILDQKIVSGLGNIYADESLWFAKINPLRKSDSLSEKEAELLRVSIVKVLREAIKRGGFTMRDYTKTSGESGSYQHFRKVYKREGLLCFRCRGKIRRIKIGGRSARFCPECQK